jgi:hypothetical protein
MRSFRFSIAGLMGVVLLAAIVSVAFAYPSTRWAGVAVLFTRGTLCLALVGAVCRTGVKRAWWIGFFAFGWAFVGVSSPYGLWGEPILPTDALLKMIASAIGAQPAEAAQVPQRANPLTIMVYSIGQSFWALLAGVAGGYLARALFGNAPDATAEAPGTSVQPASLRSLKKWVLLPVLLLFFVTLIVPIGLAGARLDPVVWAGATYLLTWWLMGLMALAALIGRGRRREFWLGATFFGMGFLFLVFSRSPFESSVPELYIPTVEFLETVRPHFETLVAGLADDPNSVAATNGRIRAALRRRVPMRFPDETTLEDIITYIEQATRSPDGKVVPIHVDPIGLQEAEKSMTSIVMGMNFEGVRLETSLKHCLKQLDLGYIVKDDLLLITSTEALERPLNYPSDDPSLLEDPFLIVGHCLLALIAAGLGGVAAPWICNLAVGRRA